jgi:hypothetical protein
MSTLKTNAIQTVAGKPILNSTGSILQVVSTPFTTTFATSSTTPVEVTGFNATIVPSSTSSKILVMGYITMGQSTSAAYLMSGYITRNGTAYNIADSAGSRGRFQFGTQQSGSLDATSMYTVVSLDSPSTTSSLTYQVYIKAESPQTVWINRGNESDGDTAITGRFVSSITLMEISG